MRIVYLCTLVLLPIMVYSTCVTVQKEDHVYPAVGEYYRWRLWDFIQGNQLTYSLDPASLFTLEQPFHKLGESAHPAPGFEIVAMRAYDIPETGAWTNHFAMMGYDEYDKAWIIYYSEGDQTKMNTAPDLKNRIDFAVNRANLKCLDLEYVDRDTFLVDCIEKSSDPLVTYGQNYVYFVKKGEPPVIKEDKVPNARGYPYVTDRKVQYHVYNSQNIGSNEEPQRILLRGQYAYGSPDSSPLNLDGNCIIELLQNNKDNDIKDANIHLDRGKLIADLNIPAEDQENFKFTLIDFKILPNGNVYILDAYNGVYIYYINDQSSWKFKSKLDVGTSPAYAFDVNNKIDWEGISHVHIVVLHETSVVEYVDGVQQKGWVDGFKASHPAFIWASQQFIVVNIANEYLLYNSDHNFLITKEILPTRDYLLNPYEPDLVLLGTNYAQRYELGYARLSAYSTVDTGDDKITFKATDTEQRECTASLKYRFILPDDTTVYDVDHDPFPEVVTYPADPFFVQEMAAGPNLIYTNGDNSQSDHVVVSVHTVWELNVTGVEWPQVADVAYADILIDPHWTDKNKFWFLYQHVNREVQIFECLAESKTSPNVACESHDNFTLPNTLNRNYSQFDWFAQEGDFLTFEFLEHDYKIAFYQSDHGESYMFYNLTYPEIPENKITSFTILKQGIYVVLEAKQQVDVWVALNAPKYSINAATLKEQGCDYKFEPKKIFGNPSLKSEFILIQTPQYIFFGDVRKSGFTLIKLFTIIPGAEVAAYLGVRTIWIVQKHPSLGSRIEEWNYESLSNIYLMKYVPTYRYQIQTPLTTDFCFETGFLFVRALDPKEQKTVILVYESNVLLQLSLHKVVDTHLLIEDGKVMNMASAGHDQMFMYVNNQQSVQKMVGFLRDAIMTITPTHLTNQYLTTLKATVNITNHESTTPKKIAYDVKFINTQTYININQEQLSRDNGKFVFTNKSESQYVEIPTSDWQIGQVLKYEIECTSCASHLIEILNPVYHLTDGSQFSQHFYDGAAFGTSMVYQTSDSLVFQDEKGELAGVYKLPLSGQYSDCYSITASEDAKLVFSGCVDKDTIFIYLSFCDGKTCVAATPAAQQIANGIKYASKLMYKDNVLFVLDNNHDRPTLYDGNLRVHKVNLDESKKTWDLDAGVVINSQYLGSDTFIPVQVADFDVVKFQVGDAQHYKIILSSTLYRIWFVHMYWDNTALKLVQHDKFELYDYIKNKQVMMTDTRFYQVRALKKEVKDKKLLITSLISTNNLATYAITFTFDVSDPTKGSPVSNTASMPYLLSNYGTWKTMNKMSVYDDHAVLVFTDSVNVLAAVYKLPEINYTSLQEGETQIVTFIGGEKDQQYTQVTTKIVLVLNKDPAQKRPVLYTNLVYSRKQAETFLIKYAITDYPQLHVQNGNQIPEQNIYLTAYNDYGQSKGVLKLTKTNPGPGPGPNPPDPDNPSKDGSSNWWWITLIVVLGVALIGVGGFFVYQKFIKKSGTPLMVQSY